MLNDVISELSIEKVDIESTDALYVVIDRIPVFIEGPDAVPFSEELHRGTLRECVEVLLATAFRMAAAYHLADTCLASRRGSSSK
jgi:hypothetical protein